MFILATHVLFGYSLDEIGDLFTIAAFIIGAIIGLGHILQKKVTNPINDLRKELARHSKKSATQLVKMHDRNNDFEDRISYLEKMVARLIEKVK